MEKWMIPWMAARKIKASAHKGNVGSIRVFEKNGFVLGETIDNIKDRAESKGGGKISLTFVDWKYPGEAK
jgi:RimJ/RimL family protein N-acetyltransferase